MTVKALVITLLMAAVVGCSSDVSPPESMAGAPFSIRDGDGQTVVADDLEEVLTEIPFDFVEPRLPAGASFSVVTAALPPTDRGGRRRTRAIDRSGAERSGR